MTQLNLKYAALPLMALASVGAAWGQADVREASSCGPQPDADGNEIALAIQCSILVTGNLRAAQDEETGAIVQVYNESNSRIEKALRSVPGLQQFRRSDARSANPTSQGVTLRGLGGNASSRALLILDGVPQADPFGGWVSWPGYEALNLASIRVRRGGGQPSVGPGALAGVIELDSLQKPGIYNGRVAYGSHNSVDAKANGIFAVGDGHISASASYARGDGFTPVVERQRGAVDRGAEYQQAGFALRAVAPLSDDTEIQANIRGFIDERDRGFGTSDRGPDQFQLGGGLDRLCPPRAIVDCHALYIDGCNGTNYCCGGYHT